MADYSTRGPVAILSVNNPPVNAIGTKVRKQLQTGITRANQDGNIKVIVIHGNGATFPVGADIKEFSGMRNQQKGVESAAHFSQVIESSNKPVVAAIHKTCLGGGMELALSAHYRVANANTRFGFPEVQLGILPGWYGTQKFPRLVGLKTALDMIPSGKQISAKQALKIGFLDEIVEGNILEAGEKFAYSIMDKPFTHRRISKMKVMDTDCQKLVEAATTLAKKRQKGLMAPIMCIKAVESSLLPFEEGIIKEQQLGQILFTSGQAAAMQYAFLAQRDSVKWSLPNGTSYKDVKPKSLKTGAVIGAGTMGTGITMTMLNAGIPVVLVEQNQKFLDRGVEALTQLYMGSVHLGRMSEAQAKACMALLKPSTSYEDTAHADVVVEAVYEDMKLKKQIFHKLDKICKPSALLCSNTSSLNIDEISSATKRPEQVIGTHFFVPAYYMRLLENVRGSQTSPETIATATAFGSKIGKVPVLVGNCNGFVGNRMMSRYTAEAQVLLFEGALPHQVDQVIEDFGIPLGPFKVGDLSGLDIGWNIRKEQLKTGGVDTRPSAVLADLLCEQGRLGRKTGKGWYRYEKAGAKEPFVDEDVTEIILSCSQKNNITRRSIGYQEILERCLYPLINEGFKILEEKIAAKPEDVDTIWLLGYGWPRQTGGPMFYATQIGLQKLHDRISHYSRIFPDVPYWKPSRLLARVAEKNLPLNMWASDIKSKI